MVDEAHHAVAPSYVRTFFSQGNDPSSSLRYRRILSFFHPAIPSPESESHAQPNRDAVPIFGFSATFSRHDGLALGSVFERIVYHRDFLDMIKEQW